ncbi:hypothetical protein [Phaeobacter inhibens]|uniref:hypothetical protein n=1 Tax=Phaeobacter inhibens TaxID=221822 RepID=UPI000AB39612|nr:hypothetical protein [Phaeobacter inhibens]WHP67558.1 hypothetical protein QMZ01_13560 [Phaeobacter inhibens]
MPIIGANGLLVLVPMAFFLESRAAAGQFDATFYSLQVVELLAGATNLVLMGLNMRDGIRLSGKAAPTTQVTLTSSETIATMTDLDAHDGWVGETSKIDQDMLRRHLRELDAPIYYCVRPAGMVTATQKMLSAAGVAEQDIRVESFTGY